MKFSVLTGMFCVLSLCAGEVYDVKSFGARGDGKTKDTAAVQKALDACAGKGGRVVVPPGVYLTGSLYVGDDTELHLKEGAVILGSPDLADYNADDAYPQNHGSVKEGWSAKHLILVLEKKNVKITGKGVIDGNGRAFFDKKIQHRSRLGWRHGGRNARGHRSEQRRPGQEIVFIECRDVAVRDVTFKDMSCWSCLFHGCENVVVGGVTVRNGFLNLNTDAFDIDSCRNVSIGDCDIVTGDDAIAIRGNPARLKDPSKVCENIRVSNIVCKVQADGVRVGVGNGTIRNVRVSDMKILESGRGLHVQCCYGRPKAGDKVGVDISDVVFERIDIRNTAEPVCVMAGAPVSTAHLKDVEFRDITSESALAPSITGAGKTRPCGISFRDCSFSVGAPVPGARALDALDLNRGGGRGAFLIRDADGISLKNVSVRLHPDAEESPDRMKNGSFETGGKEGEALWNLQEGWKICRGFGRNGGGGLVYEASGKHDELTYAEQIVDIVPGKIYDFEAWAEGQMKDGKSISVAIHYLDEKGKRVGSVFSGAVPCNKGWNRLWVRTNRLPVNARKVRIRPLVKAGGAGKVCFDDISFKMHTVRPVTVMCSSRYRDEAVDGKVSFFAGIDLADAGCATGEVETVFSYIAADGRRVRRKADMSEGSDAAVELGVSELKIGEQEISAEAVTRGGKVLGRRTLKFTRLTERVRRAVYIDRYKRVIVREKPFFPVGIYCSRAESNIIERIGKAPFNAVMAYGGLDLPMLDWCRKNGLMASGYVGDLQYLDASVAARVAKVKDHPAVLAWLMNDERPLSMLPQLHSRNRAVREADPDHPTWAVLYQIDQLRGYTGTCDAIGTDPYPLPHTSVAVAHRWAEKSRKAVFDAVPVWQTIQVFDWAAYKTKAVPGTDVSKYRAPTSAELKFMAWAQVVNGAKAIFMYAYDPLVKMDWRDPFEKRWREVCDCAEEIVSVSDILLSVEPAPALDRLPQGLAARVWRTGGKVHLLVCNATGKNLKTSIPLGSAFSGAMRTVFGGGVKREGGALAVDFPVEGYAFLSFGGCSVP